MPGWPHATDITNPCTNPVGNIPANDPCLVTVPAIDFTGVNGNKDRPIEAFAQIYIDPTTSDSGTINGCFVQQITPNELGQLGRAQPWSAVTSRAD